MVALAIVLSAIVLLLAVLVAGLLRSHADILRALHDLGAGVGDPTARSSGDGLSGIRSFEIAGSGVGASGVGASGHGPLPMGPPLPGERSSTSAPDVAGAAPNGDALALAPATSGSLTLLAFLSSGCGSCGAFWSASRQLDGWSLPAAVRLVIVTKGPEHEVPGAVAAQGAPDATVVMSSAAWDDYEVPGAPFFVLVDGTSGRRIGEGVANHPAQVAELVRRAVLDRRTAPGGGRSRVTAAGVDGPGRERANDHELLIAGVLPGDPSLYPRSLDDLYGPDGAGAPRGTERAGWPGTGAPAPSGGPHRPDGAG